MVEELVLKHGEQYRKLIESALEFLDEHEPHWQLDIPIDRPKYIKNLINSVRKN